jgi:hypothetical protein
MAATEVQNLMAGTDREEFADQVYLSTGNLFVADRTGVGHEIDAIEHRLPPVRVHLDAHGASGGVKKN